MTAGRPDHHGSGNPQGRAKAKEVMGKEKMTWPSFWNGDKGPDGPISLIVRNPWGRDGITSDGNPDTGPLYVASETSPARYRSGRDRAWSQGHRDRSTGPGGRRPDRLSAAILVLHGIPLVCRGFPRWRRIRYGVDDSNYWLYLV